jgi:4-amino-4-deoxy-L-arabinose transferase-like glycosyltransferase
MSDARRMRWVVWSLLAFGAALRIAMFLHNRSLSNDEANYAHELISRSYGHATLHTSPLFKWSVQRATDWFGDSEFALRLPSLFFGLLSLALFASLISQLLEPRAQACALLLFAVADRLIYYSTELKPYAGDVAFALTILLMGLRLMKTRPTMVGTLGCGAAGAVAVWWSLPSVFVCAGVGATLILTAWRDRDLPRAARVAVIAGMWALSFSSLYFLTQLRVATVEPGLQLSWKSAFMPLPPRSVADFEWYPVAFIKLFVDPGTFVLPGIAALAFLVGCVLLRERRAAALMLSPFVFVLAASALGRYPFTERLLLFMLPVCLLFIAEGAAWISRQSWMLAGPFTIMLLTPTVVMATYHLKKPIEVEQIKPVLGHIAERWQQGDRLYVYAGAGPAFDYYAPRYHFPQDAIVRGAQARDDWQRLFHEVDRLRGKGRVWILLSHIYTWGSASEESLILFRLDQLGTRLDGFTRVDASSYLYELP